VKQRPLGVIVALLSLFLCLVPACQPQFQAGTYTDDRGRAVSISQVPRRIVSHVPGITEILFALDLGQRVAGVSDYCNYPEEARLKEKVGGFWNPSVERIVALGADLVLTNGSNEQLMIQLGSLGITYLVIDPTDIEGVLRNIELVGRVTGAEARAGWLVADMNARMSAVRQRVKAAPRVRAFYTFATADLNNPWTAGPGSFIDSVITMAGGENIAASAKAPYVKLSIEELVSADPEVIIVDVSHGSAVTPVAELRKHPVWRQIRAVREDRVYPIDGDVVNRPGPRIIQALEEMARFLHPELFK